MSTPQFDPDDILDCARSIRPDLPDLLGAAAEPIDQQLSDLLAQAHAGQSVDQQILDLLKSNDKTRRWAGEFLSKPIVSKGDFQPLPGQSEAQETTKYICPIGNDFTRRLRPGEPIPVCRTHQVALVPVNG